MRDTQAEFRHVAWPTRMQTIVYTSLVAAISLGVALYLGLFDYLLTAGLQKTIEMLPTAPVQQEQPQNGISVQGENTGALEINETPVDNQ